MLVLTRLLHQNVVITLPTGETIVVTVAEIANGRVKLGFTAPKQISILRSELVQVGTGKPAPTPASAATEGERT